MFTEREIENLKKISSPKFKYFTYLVLLFAAVVSAIGSAENFILSQKYAHLINKDAIEIFNGYIKGYSISEMYNGAYCVAIEKMVTSIIDLFTTIMIGFLILLVKAIFKRNFQIINLIEGKKNEENGGGSREI